MQKNTSYLLVNFLGGERGVRTLAPVARPNSLANCPLHHLGISPYLLKKLQKLSVGLFLLAERVGFEPTVGYKPTAIFKTAAINQLDHLSKCHRLSYNTIIFLTLSIAN